MAAVFSHFFLLSPANVQLYLVVTYPGGRDKVADVKLDIGQAGRGRRDGNDTDSICFA